MFAISVLYSSFKEFMLNFLFVCDTWNKHVQLAT